MAVLTAQGILAVVALYAGIGLLFAIAFVVRGIGTVDPGARGGPAAFRLLMIPGAALLWPVMAKKWFRAARGERNP